MFTKTVNVITSFILATLALTFFAQPALAGGGSIRPTNFAEGQQITGKSFSPVVIITDPASGWTQPWSGQEYNMRAHGDLAGASCDTTQRVSDGQGQIKANCKADVFGTFAFDITAADGSNNATFTVFFTDPSQTSGSGFNEQTPAGDYTVHITNGNLSVTPNQVFSLNAEVKQNGQSMSNYDAVDYIRWEVLQGSMSIVTSSDHLNKNPQIRISDVGRTVIKATAVMKDGRTFQSGAITVTVAYPPTPSPTPRVAIPSPTSPPSPAGSVNPAPTSPTPSKSPAAKASPSVSPSAGLTATASATPSASVAPERENIQQPEVKAKFNLITRFQSFGKKFSSFFSHLWKR